MAKGSFFQDAVERVNQKPSYVQRLAAAYTEAQNRKPVETPVLDNAKKDTQAFAPATSLEEFMGILPTPETKNDGLDGTHVADMVRSEWARYGVDNADDYRPQADWSLRGLKGGAVGAARDSVNFMGNVVQQSRAGQEAENAVAKAMASGNTGGKTYEELYRQYIQEYTDKYRDEPLKKTVDWGESYDAETERLAQELNVSDAAREQYQFNSAIGRMAPALAVSAAGNLAGGGLALLGAGEAAKAAYTVGRVLSGAATFTSASGAAYEDAKAHGIDDDKAMSYAATVGVIELATEAISSGLGKIGGKAIGMGGLTDDLLESIAKRVSSDAMVQNAVMYAGGVLGEGFEEWLSEWGDYFANRIMVGYDTRTGKEVWNDSLESFQQGAMMSALLNCTQLMQKGVPPQDAIRQGIDETAQEAGISPNPDMNTAQPNTAAQPNVTAQTEISPAAQTMADILRNPVNRSQANKIINNPEMRAAYEAVTGETLPGVKSEAAKAVMEYSRNNAELTPIAQVVLGNSEPLQQNIDNNTAAAYNTIENNQIGGVPNGGAETNGNGTAGEGLRLGRDGAEANRELPGRMETNGRGNLQVSGIVLLSPEAQNTLKSRGVDIVETQDVSANSTAFSYALDEARNADADHGWAVTPKSPEELSENGVRSFMDANGTTGFAIAPDGDIEAVFANKAKGAPRGSTKSTIPQAVALGGTKLDCYGHNLVNLYHQYGFEPVARVKFNPEYANTGWDASKGTPDIYFMMHNGDSADTVVQKTGTYEPFSPADLATLPEMDYDTAYAYRDNLLAQRGKPVNAENTQNAAEPLTPIAQVILGQQAEQGVPQTANTPTAQDTISPAAQAMAQVAQGNTQQNTDAQGTPQYTPQQIAQANEAYGKATEVQARLDSQMQAIADKLGIAYTPGVQKSINSILSRMYRNEMKGKGSDVYALKDLARTHLEMNSWNDVPSVLRALDEMKIPYTVAAKSTSQGYKGLHLTWNDNGIGIELQLSTPEAWKVKMITEEIYAKWREAEADPNFVPTDEYWQDIERAKNLWTQLDVPDFSTIANSSGVSGLESSSQKSPSDMGLTSGPQRPSENSSNGFPGDNRTTRPSGLTNDTASIETPPVNSADIISQNGQNGNGAPRFPSAPTDPNAPAKVSETVTTVRDSLATPEGVKQLINDSIEDGGYHYFPITNDATVESSAARIRENGYDSVLRDWTASVRNGQTGAELAVTGQLLYDAAVKGGDTKLALDILTDYQLLGTNTAQGLQAMRLIQNQTPEGKLYLFNKAVDNMYDSLSDNAKAKLPDGFSINEELVNEYINAPDAKTEQAAYEAVVKDIARQLPSTLGDRWNALRYLNMLGNFRTQGRNLAGNAGMMAMTAAKNTVRYGFERLAEAVTGGKYQRNTSLVVSREMMNAARADYEVYADFVNGDSKYSEGRTANRIENDIRANRTVFKSDHTTKHTILKPAVGAVNLFGKFVEGYRKATNWAMEKGDTLFIKQQYARYLAGYLEAHGIDGQTFSQVVNGDITPSVEQQKIIDAGRNFAAKEAQEATFHNENTFARWATKALRGEKVPWYVRLFAAGNLPFIKTPANVLARSIEYSPAGFLDTVVKTVQAANGKNGVTGADVINSLSKSMTGTGLFALGMVLNEAGWIRGKEDDEDKAAFDKMRGMQDYSLVLPNGWSISLDWLYPAVGPVFMGVAFDDMIHDDGLQPSDFIDVLTRLTEPMMEMSMLQGINDVLNNIKYSDNNLAQLFLDASMAYLNQALTNTLLGQAERTFEDRRYSTFINGDNRTENVIQRNIGKASAKIPGWDYHQVEYVDAWGRTEYSGNTFTRAFENFLSPGYLSKRNSTEVDDELQRLYDAGERNVLPKRIGMSDTVGVYNEKGVKVEDRNLTQDEYVQFQKIMGSTALEMVKDLMNTPGYDGMSDAAKAKAISEIYSYAKNKATMTIEPSSKSALQTDVSKLSNPSAYYGTIASYSTAAKDSENRNYTELDSLVDTFGSLPKDVQNAVTDKETEIGKLIDAKENGYTSRQYYNVYDSVKSLTPADGYENVATWQKITDICSMDIPDKQKDYFTGNYFQGQMHDKYMAAREKGYSPYSVALAYQTMNTVKGVDANGDGRIDTGSKKAAFIQAMMGYGASRESAEYLYSIFK